MTVETARIASIQEILRGYSGRHLQYAIKLGILPTPENLNQLLKRKTSNNNGTKNRLMAKLAS